MPRINLRESKRVGPDGQEARGLLAIAGIGPVVLLHGAAGAFDELVIFGGIGLIILSLVFLSWRAGRDKKKRESRRRRRKPQD